MSGMKGLIVDTPHIDNILSGQKTWEMRSRRAHVRGTIALIRKGTGTVVGTAEIVDSVGPLSKSEMVANQSKHMISLNALNDPRVEKWNHAWVIRNARKLPRPVRYQHQPGTVTWGKLDSKVELLTEVHKSVPR